SAASRRSTAAGRAPRFIEFASSVLNDIWGFYTAPDAAAFDTKAKTLAGNFQQLELRLNDGPYFEGDRFSLVDAAFGPVFRYFDVFDRIGDFGVFAGQPKGKAWRDALPARPSVRRAVADGYEQRLCTFLEARKSY